ncbi:MAG: hypothetical protein AAFN94_17640 [Pseudomonadota bacterium]
MTYRALGLVLLCLSACTAIEREAGYPGGNLGYAADSYAIFAQGPEQRVSRYVLSMALLAPLIAETASTATEARVSSERISQMYGRLALLKEAATKCVRTDTAAPGQVSALNCDASAFQPDATDGLSATNTGFNFETQSYQVALSLFSATKQALDNLQIRTRARNLAGLSPSEIFRNILRIRFLIPVAQRYFATYRDASVILASSVIDSCSAAPATGCADTAEYKAVQARYRGLLDRPSPTADDMAAAARPIGDLYDAAYGYIEAGRHWQLDKTHAAALIAHIDRACARLAAMQQVDQLPGESPSNCTTADANGNARKLLNAY